MTVKVAPITYTICIRAGQDPASITPRWGVVRTVHAPTGPVVFYLGFDDTWHDNFHAQSHWPTAADAADALSDALALYDED